MANLNHQHSTNSVRNRPNTASMCSASFYGLFVSYGLVDCSFLRRLLLWRMSLMYINFSLSFQNVSSVNIHFQKLRFAQPRSLPSLVNPLDLHVPTRRSHCVCTCTCITCHSNLGAIVLAAAAYEYIILQLRQNASSKNVQSLSPPGLVLWTGKVGTHQCERKIKRPCRCSRFCD